MIQSVPISDGPARSPALVWNAGVFAAAYGADDGIRVAILDAAGSKKNDQAITAAGAGARFPSVVRLGSSDMLVLWEQTEGASNVVRARRADGAGNPQGEAWQVTSSDGTEARPGGVPTAPGLALAWMGSADAFIGFGELGGPVATSATLTGGGFPTLVAAESDVRLAFSAGNKIGVARVSGPGAAMTPTLIGSGAGKVTVPRLAAAGDDTFVVWEDWSAGDEIVRLARVRGDGSAATEVQVHDASGSANWPQVAWTGTHAAVVYYQFRDGPPAVFLTLMDTDLHRVGLDLEISEAAGKFPSVAWTGEQLGVAWAEPEGVVRLSLVACP